MKAAREKEHIIYKGRILNAVYFSSEIMEARREWITSSKHRKGEKKTVNQNSIINKNILKKKTYSNKEKLREFITADPHNKDDEGSSENEGNNEGNSDLQEQIKNAGNGIYVGNIKTIFSSYFL